MRRRNIVTMLAIFGWAGSLLAIGAALFFLADLDPSMEFAFDLFGIPSSIVSILAGGLLLFGPRNRMGKIASLFVIVGVAVLTILLYAHNHLNARHG